MRYIFCTNCANWIRIRWNIRLCITRYARLSVIQGVMVDFLAGSEKMQPSLVLAIHRDLPTI